MIELHTGCIGLLGSAKGDDHRAVLAEITEASEYTSTALHASLLSFNVLTVTCSAHAAVSCTIVNLAYTALLQSTARQI